MVLASHFGDVSEVTRQAQKVRISSKSPKFDGWKSDWHTPVTLPTARRSRFQRLVRIPRFTALHAAALPTAVALGCLYVFNPGKNERTLILQCRR